MNTEEMDELLVKLRKEKAKWNEKNKERLDDILRKRKRYSLPLHCDSLSTKPNVDQKDEPNPKNGLEELMEMIDNGEVVPEDKEVAFYDENGRPLHFVKPEPKKE